LPVTPHDTRRKDAKASIQHNWWGKIREARERSKKAEASPTCLPLKEFWWRGWDLNPKGLVPPKAEANPKGLVPPKAEANPRPPGYGPDRRLFPKFLNYKRLRHKPLE
jgi:hypothetical protein